MKITGLLGWWCGVMATPPMISLLDVRAFGIIIDLLGTSGCTIVSSALIQALLVMAGMRCLAPSCIYYDNQKQAMSSFSPHPRKKPSCSCLDCYGETSQHDRRKMLYCPSVPVYVGLTENLGFDMLRGLHTITVYYVRFAPNWYWGGGAYCSLYALCCYVILPPAFVWNHYNVGQHFTPLRRWNMVRIVTLPLHINDRLILHQYYFRGPTTLLEDLWPTSNDNVRHFSPFYS